MLFSASSMLITPSAYLPSITHEPLIPTTDAPILLSWNFAHSTPQRKGRSPFSLFWYAIMLCFCATFLQETLSLPQLTPGAVSFRELPTCLQMCQEFGYIYTYCTTRSAQCTIGLALGSKLSIGCMQPMPQFRYFTHRTSAWLQPAASPHPISLCDTYFVVHGCTCCPDCAAHAMSVTGESSQAFRIHISLVYPMSMITKPMHLRNVLENLQCKFICLIP